MSNHDFEMRNPITLSVLKFRSVKITENLSKPCDEEYDRVVDQVNKVLTEKAPNLIYKIHKYFFHDTYIIKFCIDIFPKKCILSIQGAVAEILLQTSQWLCADQDMNLVIEYQLNFLNFIFKKISSVITEHNFFYSNTASISIGSLIDLTTFVKRFEFFHPSFSSKYPKIEFDFENEVVYLYLYTFDDAKLYRIEFSFRNIKLLLLDLSIDQYSSRNSKHKYFYFELHQPPILQFLSCQTVKFQNRSSTIRKWVRIRNFNQNLEYTQDLDFDLLGMAKSFKIGLEDRNDDVYYFLILASTIKKTNRNVCFYVGKVEEACEKEIMTLKLVNKSIENFFSHKFSLIFACMVLFSKSYKIVDTLVFNQQFYLFLDLISQLAEENEKLVEKCLYQLNYQATVYPINLLAEMRNIFKEKLRFIKPVKSSKIESVAMRQAVISPTKIEYLPPVSLLRSRFSNIANLEYALRVIVIEDNKSSLFFSRFAFFIKTCLAESFLQGIKIADRKYEFLGSSSSQMRENGIIFYAKDDQNRTSKSLHQMAGNLSDYKRKVAKYISRFGLIFSQALFYYDDDENQIKLLKSKDFFSTIHNDKQNSSDLCFTDGIGIISKELVEKIVPYLRMNNLDYTPTAYQIRYGGCKGMLVMYEIYSDNPYIIVFRESMIKFISSDNKLGILKYSYPRPLYLNRPLVNILDHLGVSAEIFFSFFGDSTKIIARSILNDVEALKLLNIYRNRHLSYEKILKAGISLVKEPFFRLILNYLSCYRLKELKNRIRIRLPYANARCAFGVIDENRILEYGQVFFQFSHIDEQGKPTKEITVLKGTVMITKFPCMSLGDIRKFEAIDEESLHHIKDCIVFPMDVTKRPHTNEMAGSDLDGDEYAIFWGTSFFFPGKNEKPSDFSQDETFESDHDIELEDIVTFYCDFLLDNNISLIANAHLMYSDFHPEGLRSEECVLLAKKYSVSLDFQKSGINSVLEKQFRPNSRWIRPDFMDYQNGLNYVSKRILGQFYRQCQLIEEIINISNYFLLDKVQLQNPNFKLVKLGWKKYENKAELALIEYTHKITEMLEKHDLDSEAKFLSNVYENRLECSSIMLSEFFDHFKRLFEYQAQGLSDEEQMLLASAWYCIGFERSNSLQFCYNDQPLVGLPWMISDKMITLAQQLPEINSIYNNFIGKNFLEHQDLILKSTTEVVMLWINKINLLLFERISFKAIIMTNENLQMWELEEEELIYNFVQKKIGFVIKNQKKLWETIGNTKDKIVFLFNEFLLYLHDMCTMINTSLLSKDKHEEIFMIRYAVFALSFFKLDLKFSENSEDVKGFSNEGIDESFVEFVFEKCLENFLEDFGMVHKSFCVLKKNTEEDFYDMNESTKENLKFLIGGIKSICLYSPSQQSCVESRSNNLKDLGIEYKIVDVCGFPVANILLQTFLGHPNFFQYYFKRFKVSEIQTK